MIHKFSVWLRTSSNPAEIYRFVWITDFLNEWDQHVYHVIRKRYMYYVIVKLLYDKALYCAFKKGDKLKTKWRHIRIVNYSNITSFGNFRQKLKFRSFTKRLKKLSMWRHNFFNDNRWARFFEKISHLQLNYYTYNWSFKNSFSYQNVYRFLPIIGPDCYYTVFLLDQYTAKGSRYTVFIIRCMPEYKDLLQDGEVLFPTTQINIKLSNRKFRVIWR